MKYLYELYPSTCSDESINKTVSTGFQVSETLYSGHSEFQQVDVIKNPFYGRSLFLDNLMMTTEKDEFIYHESLTHVPISKLKEPERVLIIGGGDGGIARELCKYKSIKEINLVEIDELVVTVSKEYLPTIACSFNDPRVNFICTDGAKFVEESSSNYYDLVLIDSSDPVGPGIVLFQEKFYNHCKRILKENGQFSAQGMGAFVEPASQKMMYQNLCKVFSYVKPYYAVIPTYPTSLWVFFNCSNNAKQNPETISNELPQGLKYINKAMLSAVYAVPQIVLENIKA